MSKIVRPRAFIVFTFFSLLLGLVFCCLTPICPFFTTRNLVICNQSLCNWHATSCRLQLFWSPLQLLIWYCIIFSHMVVCATKCVQHGHLS
jgi:hypothetical protein